MDARYSVDARGNITCDDQQARAQLQARAGRWALAPTNTDLLLMIRSPISGAKAQAGRVVLAGDAASFPLSDLIAFLGQSRWTGQIRVLSASGERSVSLKDGEVRGATSDDPADRLGEVIVRLGYLDKDKLEKVLEDTPPSKVGRALVERGVLQAHDLWKCLTEQVSEIFHAIVLCREGAFLLLDQPPDEKSNLSLSLQSLLMDSIRKIDEMAHFRKRIPHGRLYVARRRRADGKLEKEEDLVLGLADGRRTLIELGQLAKMTEFDVTKVVYRLLEGGYAQLFEQPVGDKAAPLPARAASSGKDPLKVVRTFNRIFREIRDEVARQQMDAEFLAAANAALAKRALSTSPVLTSLAFDPDGQLPESQVVEQFEKEWPHLGSNPLASLKQALSDVMFFLLFQAGELLESRADEDLARRVKALLATIEAE